MKDKALHEGQITDHFLGVTKQTIDVILKSGEASAIRANPKTNKKPTKDISSDMIALYVFYAYTARWQKGHVIRCTTGYAAKGLSLSEPRVIRAKKALIDLQLIADEVKWVSSNNSRVKQSFVRFRFYMDDQNQPCKNSQCDNLQCKNSQCDNLQCKNSQCDNLQTNAVEIIDKCSSTIAKCSSTNKEMQTPTPSGTGEEQRLSDVEEDSKDVQSCESDSTSESSKAKEESTQPVGAQLDPLHRRLILIFQGSIRTNRRDAAEMRSWKNVKCDVNEEDVALLEWFYSLPKSEQCDNTWNRKNALAALLNQWHAQVGFAYRHKTQTAGRQQSTSDPEEMLPAEFDYNHFMKVMDGHDGVPATKFPESWKDHPQDIYLDWMAAYKKKSTNQQGAQ